METVRHRRELLQSQADPQPSGRAQRTGGFPEVRTHQGSGDTCQEPGALTEGSAEA